MAMSEASPGTDLESAIVGVLQEVSAWHFDAVKLAELGEILDDLDRALLANDRLALQRLRGDIETLGANRWSALGQHSRASLPQPQRERIGYLVAALLREAGKSGQAGAAKADGTP